MSLIDHFLTDEYKVKRMKCATYVRGEYVPGPLEEIKVWGSLQPTNARELKLPEEGNRLKQYWKFYTDQPILVNSEKNLSDSDKVYVNGDSYRVMGVTTWQGVAVDLPYFCSILYRDPEQCSDGQG